MTKCKCNERLELELLYRKTDVTRQSNWLPRPGKSRNNFHGRTFSAGSTDELLSSVCAGCVKLRMGFTVISMAHRTERCLQGTVSPFVLTRRKFGTVWVYLRHNTCHILFWSLSAFSQIRWKATHKKDRLYISWISLYFNLSYCWRYNQLQNNHFITHH